MVCRKLTPPGTFNKALGMPIRRESPAASNTAGIIETCSVFARPDLKKVLLPMLRGRLMGIGKLLSRSSFSSNKMYKNLGQKQEIFAPMAAGFQNGILLKVRSV
jgi:hypothetical protein